MHEKVKSQIEKKMEGYAKYANKGRKKVTFEPGDWVWVHFRKKRFPSQRKSKLMPRGDGPFQVLARINDNAYKIDLPREYGVSATFNVVDLTLFDAGDDFVDLRTNTLQEGGNDMGIQAHDNHQTQAHDQMEAQDPIQGIGGPMTRARAKKAQEALKHMVTILRTVQMQGETQHLEAHKGELLVLCVDCLG